MTKVDRSELAIWAEGTEYAVDELECQYKDYCTLENEAGREPQNEAGFCEHIVGIESEC